jgi:hypothetical protein
VLTPRGLEGAERREKGKNNKKKQHQGTLCLATRLAVERSGQHIALIPNPWTADAAQGGMRVQQGRLARLMARAAEGALGSGQQQKYLLGGSHSRPAQTLQSTDAAAAAAVVLLPWPLAWIKGGRPKLFAFLSLANADQWV